jgi:hypothetical protein
MCMTASVCGWVDGWWVGRWVDVWMNEYVSDACVWASGGGTNWPEHLSNALGYHTQQKQPTPPPCE